MSIKKNLVNTHGIVSVKYKEQAPRLVAIRGQQWVNGQERTLDNRSKKPKKEMVSTENTDADMGTRLILLPLNLLSSWP